MTAIPTTDDRILAAIRALIKTEVHGLVYAGTWEYAINTVSDDGTVSGTPTTSIPLPPLNNVPFAALAMGGVAEPIPGARFLVDFVNHKGSMAAIFSVDPTVKTATIDAGRTVNIGASGTSKLGPSPTGSIARAGDGLALFFPLATMSGKINGSTVPDFAATIVCPIPGTITYGNAKVRA